MDFKYTELETLLDNEILVLLDGVEDVGNFGNIIRSCEIFGVGGVIIPKNRSVSVTDAVIRTSAGAINHVQICMVVNINQTIEKLKKHGYWVYACEVGGESLDKVNLKGKVAIVLGGEHTGVKRLTREWVDGIVSIPMQGKINSLNVASAGAICLYEVDRQRRATPVGGKG